MKSWDFEAVVYDGCEWCIECLPSGVHVDDDDVCPIFASDEVAVYPVCDQCGRQHTYMNVTSEYQKEEGVS